jgi:PAS domain S-box-containing protein
MRPALRCFMLSVSEKRLYRLLDSSSDGICEMDAQGRCTFVNSTGAHILGFEGEALIGLSLNDLMHPHRADRQSPAQTDCPICRALQTREPRRQRDAVFWHKDGRAVAVSYSIVPILGDSDNDGAVLTFSDTSERTHLAQELRQRAAELSESEQRKTEFIATLAHELRNPLAPIRAGLEVMRKPSDDATSMAQLRDMMERQLSQMVHLVDDLLDIARVTSGQVELKTERATLQDIVSLAVEASAPLMAATKNSLTLETPEEPLYLQADVTRLTQVFTNILNNAARYTPAGGRVSVRVERLGERVLIDIADSGVGIDREALKRIFDMFTRVGRETPGTHAGLGIGLHLARRLVEMHAGELVATSEGIGKGSHFLVTLPLVETVAPGSNTAEGLPPEQTTRGAVRALIVDDNADAAATLSLLLELGGHTTSIAYTGPDALRIATEFKPDIVLLDIGLPGMTGYEVAHALRRMPELGHPLLVAVTGWGGPEDRLKTKQAGFDEHLTKPVDISMIELLLSQLPARTSQGTGGGAPVENGDTIDASI